MIKIISEAFIGLIGVGIGGLIGFGGQIFQIKISKEEKVKDKKEQTYLSAIEFITRYRASYYRMQSSATDKEYIEGAEKYIKESNELNEQLWSIRASLKIYGTKESYDQFSSILKIVGETKRGDDLVKLNEKFTSLENGFVKMIFKDLNIK